MAWWKSAQFNDPIVAVRGFEIPEQMGGGEIVEGRVYRLRKVFPDCYCAGDMLVHLQGIRMLHPFGGMEPGFEVEYFRPADINDLPDWLTRLLTTTTPIRLEGFQ